MPALLSPSRRLSKPEKPSTPEKKNAPASPETQVSERDRLEKRIKISSETLKKLFTSESPSKEVTKLKELIRDRTKDAKVISLKDWRVYAAIDEAYNAPFNQITPTIIGKILSSSKKMTHEEVLRELERWGLSEEKLFTTIVDPNDKTKKTKILNRDTFTTVLVPLVKSILNSRESKLFADRDQNPFLSYSPNRNTEEYKVAGDVITQLVEGITTSYGLKSVLRAAIHQTLKYSFAMAFPAEAWHSEIDIDSDGNEYTKKEGIRYNIPYPARCALDPNYRPSTINTDTGCEWGTYWFINRYGDVDSNPAYYNKDKITYGHCWFAGPYSTFFETVYPCTMQHPAPISEWASEGDRSRELQAATYTSNDHDKAVFMSNMFMKLSPKQWGLGEWKHKVWFRFVVASDDTICYAEPLPYCPILYMGSDADDSTTSRTASFALEGIPWQDIVGNILNQHLMALRQNCLKIIPYDKNQVGEALIREIEVRSKESVSVMWLAFDSREARIAQNDPSNMFKPVSLPTINTQEIIQTLIQVFNVMERALGMSAQEVGAIAGHIQTAEEIRTVSDNSSARLQYIATFIDEFIDAMKRQIYVGYQTFGDKEFTVAVNGVDAKIVKLLKDKFGFAMKDQPNNKVEITGDTSKLSVDAFISSREGKTRLNQPQIAQVMMQTIQAIAANPELAAKIGAEEIIRQLNRAAKLAGAPEDFDFRILPEAAQANEMKQMLAAIQQYAKEITDAAVAQATQAATETATNQAVDTIAKEVVPVIQDTQDAAGQAQQGVQQVAAQSQQIEESVKQLSGLVLKLEQFISGAMQAPPEPPMDMPVNDPMMQAQPMTT